MAKLTLTKEKMIDNLYLVSEEIMLQCMILNRRKLVQAMIYGAAHVDQVHIEILPANTAHRFDVERTDALGEIRLKLDFYDWMDIEECQKDYSSRMDEAEVFVRYLDHLIAINKRIEVEIKEVACD